MVRCRPCRALLMCWRRWLLTEIMVKLIPISRWKKEMTTTMTSPTSRTTTSWSSRRMKVKKPSTSVLALGGLAAMDLALRREAMELKIEVKIEMVDLRPRLHRDRKPRHPSRMGTLDIVPVGTCPRRLSSTVTGKRIPNASIIGYKRWTPTSRSPRR